MFLCWSLISGCWVGEFSMGTSFYAVDWVDFYLVAWPHALTPTTRLLVRDYHSNDNQPFILYPPGRPLSRPHFLVRLPLTPSSSHTQTRALIYNPSIAVYCLSSLSSHRQKQSGKGSIGSIPRQWRFASLFPPFYIQYVPSRLVHSKSSPFFFFFFLHSFNSFLLFLKVQLLRAFLSITDLKNKLRFDRTYKYLNVRFPHPCFNDFYS